MLKKAKYKCWGFGFGHLKRFNEVVYTIIEDRCYFSGIELEDRTSTINAAESVIAAISKQEGILVGKLRWFDLLTHTGYAHKEPGKPELSEVIIGFNLEGAQEGGVVTMKLENESGEACEAEITTQDSECFRAVTWVDTRCPPEILSLFQEFIG